ncbi:hypothetical protein Sste5346_008820 [Sporothrix stenoceras]|uniref:Zn(2)-C6 fungal-type domain-containing protein n=1 Tax=Sporothrix stenoceras TaxID=5173 RepID=A0ABR3YNZ4_9PEZI
MQQQQPSQASTARAKGSKAARGAGSRTAAARANNAATTNTAGATVTDSQLEATQTAGTEGAMPSNTDPKVTQSQPLQSTTQQPLPPPQPQDSPAASSTSATAATNAAPTTAPPKRQRVSRACDQCRAMREKCDGAQPQCSSCVSQQRACTYKTSPKKRGVQTGYIRTLELTLSSLLDEVPGCADALDGLFGRHGGDAAQRLFNPEASAASGTSTQQQQKDLERHNRLHRRWHKSRARREINRLLSTDGFSAGVTRPLSDRAGSDDDSDGEAAPAAASATLARPPGVTSAVTWSPSENTIPSPLSNTGTGHDNASMTGRLPLPPNHWRLLDVYFSYTHCWFPILERQDVLKAVYQYERELGEQQATSAPAQAPPAASAATAELWSVLALASFQDAASRSQQQHQQHPDSNTPSTQTRDWPAWSPHRVYDVARQMIPLDDGPFEIQHARALLLLALVNVGRRRYTAARVLIALSRQIVQDADCLSGVNDYARGPMSMRRRIVDAVTSGCCILEAFLSIIRSSLGQQVPPQHHHATYRSHQSPGSFLSSHTPHNCPAVPEDGLDEWQPWVPCLGFGVEDAAASERSPAYSLTTFNQLHALFTFMQHQGANASSSPSDYNDVIAAAAGSQYGIDGDALDRVLRPDVPFAAFVRSPERASAAVPSAFVLRITFVWMHILLSLNSRNSTGIDHVRAHLLADVLEQFVARFGAAGAPPMLVPCALTVVGHPSFKQLPPPLQQRLCALGDALEGVWDVQLPVTKQQQSILSGSTATSTPRSNAVLRQKLTPGGTPSTTAANMTPVSASAPTSAPPPPPASVVYQSASPEAAVVHQQQQAHQGQQHQGQQRSARHHRMSFLEQQPPQPPQPPQQQQQPQQTQSQDVNMYNNGAAGPPPPPPAFGFHPLPISPPPAGGVGSDHQQHPPSQQPPPPPPPGYPMMGTPYPGDGMAVDAFGGAPGAPGTLDYEALLDDLSAVNYLDRLDADIGSQFMANLGFAPGMDNNNLGTMMGEFGGL